MTLIIENVKEEYVPAFREFAKKMNANLTAESSDDECPICKAHDYRFEPSDRLLEAICEVEEMKKNPNDYKGYSSGKEVIEACLNG
ncbi:hypothetical protein ACWIUD_00215 [Helicobacter sp. 23-1044]